jgi:hypothetical protein
MQREPAAFLWDVNAAAPRIRESAFRNILIHGYAALEKAVQHLLDAEPSPNAASQGKPHNPASTPNFAYAQGIHGKAGPHHTTTRDDGRQGLHPRAARHRA